MRPPSVSILDRLMARCAVPESGRREMILSCAMTDAAIRSFRSNELRAFIARRGALAWAMKARPSRQRVRGTRRA
jgi:hypothetical protein